MKLFKTKIAVLAIASCAAGPLCAGELLPVRNCTWCHGTAAQGYFVAPRLAGQRPRYIVNQLLRFHRHIRDNPASRAYMWPATVHVGPGLAHALAGYFSSLPPEASDDGHKDLVADGRRIYRNGIPTANVVSCMACHGPRAAGIRQIPRLGGMPYAYLKRRLWQWKKGYDASASPMPRVVRTLSPYDIKAIASYLSFVQYGSAER